MNIWWGQIYLDSSFHVKPLQPSGRVPPSHSLGLSSKGLQFSIKTYKAIFPLLFDKTLDTLQGSISSTVFLRPETCSRYASSLSLAAISVVGVLCNAICYDY